VKLPRSTLYTGQAASISIRSPARHASACRQTTGVACASEWGSLFFASKSDGRDTTFSPGCRFAFKRRLFTLHNETLSLGVSSDCRKQHSQKYFRQLFCEGRAATQSHNGGTKVCFVSSCREKAQEGSADFKVLGKTVLTFLSTCKFGSNAQPQPAEFVAS